MTRRLLVLGGTAFVGKAVVAQALARGWSVTALNRGVSGRVPPGAVTLRSDRTDPDGLRALVGGRWDAVIDTWRDAADAVLRSTSQLTDAVDRY